MKIKLDIYCGLLGVGKTTLIRKMLETTYQGVRVAIIENEVGKINLDAGEFAEASIAVREITSGCICCTLKGDFTQAIGLLAEQERPQYIIVEPSGVANLPDIVSACTKSEQVVLNRVIMVVKANRFQKLAAVVGDFFFDQIRIAKMVYLNFTEKMSPEQIEEVKVLLWNVNPSLQIVETPVGQLDASSFPEEEYVAEDFADSVLPAFSGKQMGAGRKKIRRLKSVENGDDNWMYEFQSRFDDARVQKLLSLFQEAEAANVWRVKGYLLMQDGGIRKVDVVYGDSYQRAIDQFDSSRLNLLVIIGKGLNIRWLRERLEELDDEAFDAEPESREEGKGC